MKHLKKSRGWQWVGAVLAVTLVLSEAIGGEGTPWQSQQEKVLAGLTQDAQILINLDASDLPSTTDMIRLGRQATPAIINGLVGNMDANVRAACAAVLTGTRDPRAVAVLLDALEDPTPWVRSLAIAALGQLESREATPRLLALLDKANVPPEMKNEAVVALGRMGDPRAVKPLIKYFEKTWEGAAQDALWNLRRHLSEDQVARLATGPLAAAAQGPEENEVFPPYNVLEQALEIAARLEVKAARASMEKLYASQEGLQNKIIYGLGKIGDKKAVPFLKALLDPASPARVLNNVAFALDRLGEDVSPFLTEALGDRRAYIRFNAAFVAGDLKKKALVPALAKALTDPNDYVRSNAALALGTIGDAAAVAALETTSQEKNPVVRGDALLALAQIDYGKYRDRLLKEAVGSEHPGTREKAVQFLVKQKDASVVPAVLAALSPDDYRGRSAGLSLLGAFDQLDSPAATAFLLRAAASGEQQAFVLLGRFADARATFVLRQWLSQPGGNEDQLLRIAGRMKDGDSRPFIEPWTGEKVSHSAQLHAAFALAAIAGDGPSGAKLALAIETAPLEIKQIAARLMTELELAKVPGLQERLGQLLAHEDVYVRLYAARALLARGNPAAVDVLKRELDKKVPFIYDEAIDILERMPPAHRDPVIKAWQGKADTHLAADLSRIMKPE